MPGDGGENPFLALANAFNPTLERHCIRPRDMAFELEKDASSFNKFLAMALENKPAWAEFVLFIDQFEELFTLVDKKHQNPDDTGAEPGALPLMAFALSELWKERASRLGKIPR